MSLAEALAPIVDFAFPPRCPLCGERLLLQQGLCAACWSELVIPGEPACALCQRPFAETIAAATVCAPCLAHPPRHDGIAAATLYTDASRRLVLSFKHGRRIALAPMMARLMAARLTQVEADWLVVPVPLHRWRLWRRGFNQGGAVGPRGRPPARSHPRGRPASAPQADAEPRRPWTRRSKQGSVGGDRRSAFAQGLVDRR